MHESGLARQVLDLVCARARDEGAARIRTVSGWVAETEALSIESLRFHFAALAKGTLAEGARLELELRRVAARCARCRTEYEPDHHILLCPACGATEGALLGRTGLGIEKLELEEPT
jgi:hydrogenase nickel incorporation protein HypA/HybF